MFDIYIWWLIFPKYCAISTYRNGHSTTRYPVFPTVLISCGHCDKLQLDDIYYGGKKSKISITGTKIKVLQGHTSTTDSRGEYVFAPSSFWWLPRFLGMWTLNSKVNILKSLCLSSHHLSYESGFCQESKHLPSSCHVSFSVPVGSFC